MFDAQAKGGIQVLPFEVTGHKLQQYIQQKKAPEIRTLLINIIQDGAS